VRYTDHLGNAPFELLDTGPVIRKPPAVQYVVDAREQLLAVSDVRLADVDPALERGKTTKDREILYP
jgi:hypothetical protein